MATAGVPLWSTTAASNSSADPAVNFAEGMAPSAVNDSGRALMASVAKWRDDLYGLTTGGTSTAFTVTTNATYATAAVMSGGVFTIIPHTTSGASATLAVDSLTARALNISTGVAAPSGLLISGTPYLVKYVHASTEFIVLGTAAALSTFDIIGGTQLTSIATDDTLPIYDLSATANRRILISDVLKVVNSLTADASPDTAADYVMTYDASASAAKKVLLQNLPGRLSRGYIDGCILANGTDATNDINVAAGVCRDSTNAVDITVATMAGKQLDANWAAGASAGMRNSAVGIANTTYHIYAVAKADGTQDIYAHTSTTVATVITALQAESGGSAYLYARRIGSIVRAGGAVNGFVQRPNGRFDMKVFVTDYTSGSNPGTGELTIALPSIPTGISVEAIFSPNIVNAGANELHAIFYSPDIQQPTVGTGSGDVFNAAAFTGQNTLRVYTSTSAEIRGTLSASTSSVSITVLTRGWTDPRGKDA